ncbi:MAG: CoA activase, partial [Firmicutes bacterium]|nr:CoA activase [Bacillota bacterium]
YMAEELPLWQKFFDLLSIRTVTGEQCREAVKRGKSLAGAEFCAPMAAMYGQIEYLAARADFVFMPFYLQENRTRDSGRKQYCYYSQYAASLAARVPGLDQAKLLTPMLKSIRGRGYGLRQLFQALQQVRPSLTYGAVSSAYRAATRFFRARQEAARSLYRQEAARSDRFHIVLAGRPYTVLADSMNNDIPGIIARLGIKVFYSGDLPAVDPAALQPFRPLFDAFQWVYASRILQAALYAARTEGVYPVLMTSFKCSPDSFTIEYFKQIMDHYGKPYLILQLDEHDSSLGYETRIEAAVRTFANHFQSAQSRANARSQQPRPQQPRPLSLLPDHSGITADKAKLRGKTLLFPNWDSLICRLLVANLRAQGIDARLLEETPEYIRQSMSHNTGQCIPLNIIAQEAMEYVQKYDLDPAQTALWMCKSALACNFCMFPYQIKNIFKAAGNGMEKIGVYLGTIAFFDISIPAGVGAYFASYLGGMLRKAACAIRPYELRPGETDRVTAEALELIAQAMEKGSGLEESVSRAVDLFAAIKRTGGGERPRVALFGDIYTRYNDVINQDLIKLIEANGGEVVITPQSEFYKIVADAYIHKWIYEGSYPKAAAVKVLMKIIPAVEKKFNRIFKRIIPVNGEALPLDTAEVLAKYRVRCEHSGESVDNLLKTYALAAGDPRITLFVQASPAFCCPSLVTQAMSRRIEAVTGIPVVSIEYDGSGSYKNDPVIPYLKLLAQPAAN